MVNQQHQKKQNNMNNNKLIKTGFERDTYGAEKSTEPSYDVLLLNKSNNNYKHKSTIIKCTTLYLRHKSHQFQIYFGLVQFIY